MITEYLPEVGTATKCMVAKTHEPKPLRYVWHHILPKVCGGQTVETNLVSCCDNCHYGVHALLWALAQNGGKLSAIFAHFTSTARYDVAMMGYERAVEAGTVAQIPNEGSD